MDISVVILSWNSKKHLAQCLPKLKSSLDGSGYSYEIFVVDNGSEDGSVEYIEKLKGTFDKVLHPIYLKANMGTTYSRNLALQKAQGDYIAILDSDVELQNNIFTKLLAHLKSAPDTGLIAPKLIYPSGKLQKSTDSFPTITRKIVRFFFLKWIEKKAEYSAPTGLLEVDYAISAFWLFPRRILETVGLLDENIFYAPEDVDYCLRIQKCGMKIIYDPTVSAVHHAQEISRGLRVNKATIEHVKGLVYCFKKHNYLFFKPKF